MLSHHYHHHHHDPSSSLLRSRVSVTETGDSTVPISCLAKCRTQVNPISTSSVPGFILKVAPKVSLFSAKINWIFPIKCIKMSAPWMLRVKPGLGAGSEQSEWGLVSFMFCVRALSCQPVSHNKSISDLSVAFHIQLKCFYGPHPSCTADFLNWIQNLDLTAKILVSIKTSHRSQDACSLCSQLHPSSLWHRGVLPANIRSDSQQR